MSSQTDDEVRGSEPDADGQVRGSLHGALTFGMITFVLVGVIGLAGTIATSRIYGAEIVGQFAIALVPAGAAAALSTFREQAALVRRISLLEPGNPMITALFAVVASFSFALTLAVSLAVGAISLFAIPRHFHHSELVLPAMALLANYLLCINTAWNLDTVFSAFRAGRDLMFFAVGTVTLFVAAAVALSFEFLSVWGLVIATVISTAVPLLHRLIRVWRIMPLRPGAAALREAVREFPAILKWSLKVSPGPIADGLGKEGAMWVLGGMVPLASVGVYSRAWQLSVRLMDVNYRVTAVLFPTQVAKLNEGDSRGAAIATLDSARYSATFMLALAATVAGAAAGVMNVFGPGFASGANALALLMFVPVLLIVSSCHGHVLLAADRPTLASSIVVARTVLLIAVMIPLASSFGITGAAAAVLIAYGIDVLVTTVLAWRQLGVPAAPLWSVRGRAGVVASGAAGYALSSAIDSHGDGLAWTLIAMVAGLAGFAAVSLIFGGWEQRDRDRFETLVVPAFAIAKSRFAAFSSRS